MIDARMYEVCRENRKKYSSSYHASDNAHQSKVNEELCPGIGFILDVLTK